MEFPRGFSASPSTIRSSLVDWGIRVSKWKVRWLFMDLTSTTDVFETGSSNLVRSITFSYLRDNIFWGQNIKGLVHWVSSDECRMCTVFVHIYSTVNIIKRTWMTWNFNFVHKTTWGTLRMLVGKTQCVYIWNGRHKRRVSSALWFTFFLIVSSVFCDVRTCKSPSLVDKIKKKSLVVNKKMSWSAYMFWVGHCTEDTDDRWIFVSQFS